jgi:acetyl-CoA decarbonylase/synthase complex subunit gamma
MALSGIQIYKLLPQTNCKECGFPTCLAFAMKLAAKQVDLSACPYVSEESKAKLEASSAPPIRLISLKSDGHEIKVGNEVVLFRHEKTFYNKPGLFVAVYDDMAPEDNKSLVQEADSYQVNYVGMELTIDGFAIISRSAEGQKFSQAVELVRSISSRPVILVSSQADIIEAGVSKLSTETFMICGANDQNWEAMTEIAKVAKASLVVEADSLDGLTELTEKIKTKGVEDLVLHPTTKGLSSNLAIQTQIRRLALRNNFKPLGFPTMMFASSPVQATQAITKYNGFLVMDKFSPELIYPLLVLRENIYTDPQKPIQVQPSVYEINNPKPEDPVLVTTNFSITYFSVANEVEGSGMPAWLLVTDAEGMSVLTAWAAGKFDSERIAKSVKEFNLADKVTRKRIVLPGHVAVLSGELEEELPDWEIKVGPREAVDIPKYLKQVLQ